MPETTSPLAQNLVLADDLGHGTLVSLIIRKKKTIRGGCLYGDDLVHTLVWSGSHYPTLVQRSKDKLLSLWAQGNLVQTLQQEVKGLSQQEGFAVIQELLESFNRVVLHREHLDLPPLTRGEPELESRPFVPWEVGGCRVLGAKLYQGHGKGAPGVVYLDGVKLGEKVLEAAPHGPVPHQYLPKTIAKLWLRKQLPVGRYVRYCLSAGELRECQVGLGAARAARSGGVPFDPEAILTLFKV